MRQRTVTRRVEQRGFGGRRKSVLVVVKKSPAAKDPLFKFPSPPKGGHA
jgi:hypothetical protein